MNDYIAIFCLFIPGVLLLILAFYSHKKFYGVKDISSFLIDEREKTVYLKDALKYAIVIVGAGSVKKFPLRITSLADGKNIDGYKIYPQYKSIKNGQMSVTYCQFTAAVPGEYSIRVGEQSKISVQKLPKGLISQIFADDISPANLSILIKEYSSPMHFLWMITGSIIGPMMILAGVSLVLFNHGIIVPYSTQTTTVVKHSF